MKIACKECKRSWHKDTYDGKKYGNRCPHCGNHYLVVIRSYHEQAN